MHVAGIKLMLITYYYIYLIDMLPICYSVKSLSNDFRYCLLDVFTFYPILTANMATTVDSKLERAYHDLRAIESSLSTLTGRSLQDRYYSQIEKNA
jgi:hypothetical protein